MSSSVAEILSQGDEVVSGVITDTNAAWLSRELSDLGFEVSRHTVVGDRLEALADLLREIAGRADLCLSSGGLGPTSDDLTAEAVALAFGVPLALDREALARIEHGFTALGRPMPAVNRKQALLPAGSERLDNLWGTAPGFALRAGRCQFAFMPGVPAEMKAMFQHWVSPDLKRRFALRPPRRVVLSTVGIGESALQERLDRITLPPSVRLGFHAGGPENKVKLLFPSDFPEHEQEAVVTLAAAAVGEAVYAIGTDEGPDSTLEAAVGRALGARGTRLYAVETVSGGALSQRCAGADWFLGATVAADSAGLPARLGITAAPSPAETAGRMAAAVRGTSGADYVLVQFGEFTPAELHSATGLIRLHFVLAGPAGTCAESRTLGGSLQRKRQSAAALGLDFVRRSLPATEHEQARSDRPRK